MPETRTTHRTIKQLQDAMPDISVSPATGGTVEMISRRPKIGERELLDTCELDQDQGLIGDNWIERGSSTTPDGSSNPDAQITIINSRIIDAIAGSKSRWQLAGDQLVIDIDLSHDNLPPGTRLSIGSAVVELTAEPHTGCAKFMSRFGNDALRFVSGKEAMRQRRRGANAKIIKPGTISVGDVATKVLS